ncbi:hypothetical protein ACWDA9_34920, partial [Streptomyces sp. NPDC001193]
TAGVLILAANTAFNGFPMLASILARDRYASLPRSIVGHASEMLWPGSQGGAGAGIRQVGPPLVQTY